MRVSHLLLMLALSGFATLSVTAQDSALMDPARASETAPDTYRVQFKTTKGDFTVKINRSWSPNGADRFYNLVKIGYFKDIAFFRVITGFMAQFGVHGNPAVNTVWSENSFPDDPSRGIGNRTGTLVFAKKGLPNSRSTQLYINTSDNFNLDAMGFTPLGEVEGEGMTVVKALYAGYGEGMPNGRGPHQGMLVKRGNEYLKKFFPNLDYINSIELLD